jgi:hypothetical protein
MSSVGMASPTPKQVSDYLRAMADGIDRSKSPDPARVAADIRKVIAALEPGAPKPAPQTASESKPIKLSFKGEVGDGDLMARAAAEVAKRRPGLQGKAVKFSLTVEPADK